MRSLRLKIIFTYTLVSVVVLILMRMFHGFYVLYDPTYIGSGLASFIPIVGTIMLVSAIYIGIKGKHLDNVWNKIVSNDSTVTDDDKHRAHKIMSSVPIVIIWINALGFFVGPVVTIFLKLNGAPFFTSINILTILYNIGLGLVAALFEIRVIDNMFTKPRDAFNQYFIEDDMKTNTSSLKTLGAIGASLYLTIVVYISAITGYLINGVSLVEPQTLIVRISLLGLALMALILPIVFTYTSYISYITNMITARLKDISQGEGDLSRRMSIIKYDEFGKLTDSINRYMDNLKDLLIRIHDTHGKVSAVSHNMYETSKKIGDELKEVVDKSRNVEKSSVGQLNLVSSADESISKVTESISRVSDSLKDQITYVSSSSAAIEEMVSNISSVSTIAQRANEQSLGLRDVSQKGEEAVSRTAKAFKEVESSSEEMKNIVSLISKISAQTNLLAMNAAIEAAHAGEAGKGFAVVADEVRKLAEDSGNSIKRIVELIKVMNSKIENGVNLSKDAEVAFRQISTDVSSTTELIGTISNAMVEQQNGADDILNSINSLVSATKGIENLSMEQERESHGVEDSIHELKSHSVKITADVETQNQSFSDINTLSDKILELSKENSLAVEELQDSISKFRF